MKVYVVFKQADVDSSWVDSVHSRQESAQAVADAFNREIRGYYAEGRGYYADVVELELKK